MAVLIRSSRLGPCAPLPIVLGVGLCLWASPGETYEPPGSASYRRDPDPIYAYLEPNVFYHNAGLLTLQVTNVGQFGSSSLIRVGAGWRGGEYLYQSGLWIGAIGADSAPHVSNTYYTTREFLPERDIRWTVMESYEGQDGAVRLGLLGREAADDDGDGLLDEDFQNGLDDDRDGRVDEDFEAIGQQMYSCMYRDDTPEAIGSYPDHYPLNLFVRQRSFQWSTSGLNEFVGIDFEVTNRGEQRLKDLYLGFFSDADAGPKSNDQYYDDDLVGWSHIDSVLIDTRRPEGCQRIPLAMDAIYMWDAKDDGIRVTGGDVTGVFGSLFLGHTTDDTGLRAPQNVGLTTVAWFSSTGEETDPQDDIERYALLSSGQKPTRSGTQPNDYRYVISAGPFATLDPGESLVFQTAYVVGEGQTGFRANAVNAQRVFNGQYLDLDRNPETGVDGKERCLQILELGGEIVWDDPCDTLNTTVTFRRTPPCDQPGTHYVDADCDPCTGIGGAETLTNWVGTTAPAPPGSNIDPDVRGHPAYPGLAATPDPAGDRRVILDWDNASELSVDPITNSKLFRGYRIWRADNWQRPEGSIGPAPEEWMKLAEFRTDVETAGSHGAVYLYRPFPEGGPLQRDVRPVGEARDGTPIYPVGRYRYVDTDGILNGKVYFYCVTAFGIATVRNSVTGEDEELELSGLPSAVEAEEVVPRWDSTSGCDQVTVVPNPYRGRADWDLIPSATDPTGTKIAFRNLPDGQSTLRIFTLAGDLVQEVDQDGTNGNGTYFWNLLSRNGQNVVSGVFLYTVTSEDQICRGRFVIIR